MNTEKLIARGIELKKTIETAIAELKTITADIITIARHTDHVDLVDAEREGKQALLAGADDVVLPVIFESDMILGTIPAQSAKHKDLLIKYKAENLGNFYRQKNILEMLPKDGKAFRKLANHTFAPDTAAQFVRDCLARDKHGIPKSRIVVAWDDIRKKNQLPCLALPILMASVTQPQPGWRISEAAAIALCLLIVWAMGVILGAIGTALWIESADKKKKGARQP